MTPAIDLLKKNKILLLSILCDHDPNNTHFGDEAAEKLGLDPHQSFKTLLVAENGDQKIGLFCAFHGKYVESKESGKINCVKKVEMADKDAAQKSTGYLVGGISPLGQKTCKNSNKFDRT